MMDEALDLVIVSGNRIFAEGLQRLWEAEPGLRECRIAGAAELRAWEESAARVRTAGGKGGVVARRGTAEAGGRRSPRARRAIARARPFPGLEQSVLMLAPQDWQEMERLLRGVKAGFGTRPWLVAGELRAVGAFIDEFRDQWATLVGSGASSEELRDALAALLARRAPSPGKVLEGAFKRGVQEREKRELRRWPTARELQYGCAASLGLNNPEIARLLHVGHGTVKSQVWRLRQVLGLARQGREELEAYFERVLEPLDRGAEEA